MILCFVKKIIVYEHLYKYNKKYNISYHSVLFHVSYFCNNQIKKNNY